jgi:hypothetical protein
MLFLAGIIAAWITILMGRMLLAFANRLAPVDQLFSWIARDLDQLKFGRNLDDWLFSAAQKGHQRYGKEGGPSHRLIVVVFPA